MATAQVEEERAVSDNEDDDDDMSDGDYSQEEEDGAAAPAPASGGGSSLLPEAPVLEAEDPHGSAVPPPQQQPNPNPNGGIVASYYESRPLFQRLWTEEDELMILRGFAEFTARRGTAFASHQYDTGPFFEDMRRQLQLEFSKSQLNEKLRRLKRKYRNCVSRIRSMGAEFAFKSPHEQAVFEIARNIWRPGSKRGHDSDGDEDVELPNTALESNEAVIASNGDRVTPRPRRRFRRSTQNSGTAVLAAMARAGTTVPVPVTVKIEDTPMSTQMPSSTPAAVSGIMEETAKSCLSKLFKELINSVIGGHLGLGLGGAPAALGPLPLDLVGKPLGMSGEPIDEKWKQQQILELEVYLKRVELLQDHIKSTLEELKSSATT